MGDLRARAENDLATTLESDFGVHVELTPPDGVAITTSVNDGLPLMGQVMYDYLRQNPDTGADVIVKKPVVTLRKSSLLKVPKPGETWEVKIPISPLAGSPLKTFIIDADAPPEGGDSLGIIRLYLRKVKQI